MAFPKAKNIGIHGSEYLLLEKCNEGMNTIHTSAYKWFGRSIQWKVMSPYSERMNDMRDIFTIGIQAKLV